MAVKLITYAPLSGVGDMAEADIKLLDAVNLYSLKLDVTGRVSLGKHGDMSAIARYRRLNPGIKFLAMLTGANCSDAFLTRAGRERFADSLMELIVKWDLDGMDNDWEVPTLTAGNIKGRPEDRLTYTMAMRAVRERMNAEELSTGRTYMLTCALLPGLFVNDTVEVEKIAGIVDYINVMTYDMRDVYSRFEKNGGRVLPVGHDSNLYPSLNDPDAVCAERAVEMYRAWGVPDDKIVVGAALYAKRYKRVPAGNNALMAESANAPEFMTEKRAALISNYIEAGYTRHWDAAAKACYLTNAEKREFITYEDAESIAEKARYVRNENLAGLMFWEYSYDDTHTLIPAAYKAMWGGA